MRRVAFLAALFVGAAGCQPTKPTPTDGGPESATKSTDPKPPRLVLAEKEVDLGEADFGQTRTASVRVSNSGGEPLRLELAGRSCSCGEVVLPNGDIPPGGEGLVTVRWTPTPGKTRPGSYRLTVDLTTNDPSATKSRLEFPGRVTPLVRLLPEERQFLDFLTFQSGTEVEREVRLVSSRLPAFDVEARTTLPGLKTTLTKLAADPDGEGFTSGYLLKVRTTADLPNGCFRDTLTMNLKAPDGKTWSVELPVYGEVRSGLCEVQPSEVHFAKKSVAEADAKTVRVQFFVPSEDEALRVARYQPSFLKIDGPRRLKAGQWEFTVSLPASNPEAMKAQADLFFEGYIVLTTTRSPKPIQVRVKWYPSEND